MTKCGQRQLSKIAALCVFFLDNFGIAVVYPVFTPLLLRAEYGLVDASIPIGTRTIMLGVLIIAFPFAQMFGGPLLGRFADLSGRRLAFFLTLIGEAGSYLLSGLGIEVGSYALLLVSRLLTGLFASNLTLSLATIADLSTTPKERSKNFGQLATVAGLSFIVAIFIGGAFSSRLLDHDFSSALPFWIASGISLLNLYIVVRFYRETSPTPREGSFSLRLFFQAILPSIKQKALYSLYIAYFFFMLGWVPSLQFLSYFMIERFNVQKDAIVFVFLGVSGAWMLGTICINPLLQKGLSPKGLAITSTFFAALFLFIPLAEIPFHSFALCYSLAALCSSLAWVNITSWISLTADKTTQGKSLGLNQTIGFFAIILGALVGILLLQVTDRYLIGFIASSVFISFLLLLFIQIIRSKKTKVI